MKRLLALFLGLLLAAFPVMAEIIYQKRSLYRNILVSDDGARICMRFTLGLRYHSLQSCQFKHDPDELVFDYAKMSFAGLLINPKPERILVAGLGGGSIPRTLRILFPDAQIDVVEIDPAVVDVAERFFGFEESENLDVIVRDARVFVKQQLLKGEGRYDYIVLDAFNGEYIPEHLMTKEFLEECRRLLTDDGVLVANTFSSSRLYHSESATYQAAFGWFIEVREEQGNRIIVTAKGTKPTREELVARARKLRGDFARFGIVPGALAQLADTDPSWQRAARVLTDQYAPVNLLQGEPGGFPGGGEEEKH